MTHLRGLHTADWIAVAFVAILLGVLARYFWTENKWTPPYWRRGCAVLGFSFATVSTSLDVGETFYTHVNGSFNFYDPFWLALIRTGSLTALLGLILGLLGKGRPRVAAATMSALMLLNWFSQAMSQ